MASSPALDLQPQESHPDPACREAQKWIEQVTGRSFGEKDFRTGLENGILLCELLNAIKPGLIKKINRLPTPIAGLDNVTLFLRGCKELGLKESQLFDPGDLQENSNRTTVRLSDCNRKLRNVLVTVYWLGKAANSCASYSGNHLDLKEFEGLLAQLRKENEEIESPKRSIRDSGYIDCWDSERSDSLSPPRHGRDDSFDSLDSFGSRSQQTPSPDVVLRGSSDGRGSDSESDLPHRRLPDVRKDDMSARRVSFGENKVIVPFNQYLPNKSNQTAYIPAPLRKKKAEREDYRKSWSTATSPLGGERPLSPNRPETIEEEGQTEDGTTVVSPLKGSSGKTSKLKGYFDQQEDAMDQPSVCDSANDEEVQKLKSLQKVGIKVMPAAKRYGSCPSHDQTLENHEPDIVLQREITRPTNVDSEEEDECRVPDIERDDLATRRARMNRPKVSTPFNQYIQGSYINKTKPTQDCLPSTPASPKRSVDKSNHENQDRLIEKGTVNLSDSILPRTVDNEAEQEKEDKIPDVQRDDLAKRKAQSAVSQQKEPLVFTTASITKADLETWQRLKLSTGDSENVVQKEPPENDQMTKIDVTRAANDDFGRRKLSLQEKRARNKQKFVHFGPVTEIDQQRWDKLCIAKPSSSDASVRDNSVSDIISTKAVFSDNAPDAQVLVTPVLHSKPSRSTMAEVCRTPDVPEPPEKEDSRLFLDTQRDDMLARRIGTFQKCARVAQPSPDLDSTKTVNHGRLPSQKMELKGHKQPLQEDTQHLSNVLPSSGMEASSANPSLDVAPPALVEDVRKEDQGLQDRSTPEPRKTDVLVRGILLAPKQSGATLSHFLPMPFSVQQKVEEKSCALSHMEKEPTSYLQTNTFTQSSIPQGPTPVRSEDPSKLLHQNKAEDPNEIRDDLKCQPTCSPMQGSPTIADLKSQQQESHESCDHELSRFSTRSALSDDAESVSMCDMRYEEEGSMLPHSKAHHEHLQFVNDLLKEEDDTWQNDLARWKTRRRSASQDLIKKEEERKKMEKVLRGEDDSSERRKSIKTYKEIVEEKERREKELHEAYKNAKSRDEAEKILQKYIERFTISEAVLERLVMPKIMERSHSVEPGLLSSSEDPNPLKYLRQESLPSPKFTATVEATISPSGESELKTPAVCTSPTKNVVSKAVPMLTPKPYSQPRNTQQVLKRFKVDGKVSENGETPNGTVDQRERGASDIQTFAPSLTRSQRFEGVARVDPSASQVKMDVSSIELSLTRPNVQSSITNPEVFSQVANHTKQVDSALSPVSNHMEQMIEDSAPPAGISREGSAVTSIQFMPSVTTTELTMNGKDEVDRQQVDANSLVMHWSLDSVTKEQKEMTLTQVKRAPEDGKDSLRKEQYGSLHKIQLNITLKIQPAVRRPQCILKSGGPESSENSSALQPPLNSPSRFCTWDPEEERRRQERWQQEQERLLQERYQKEQEKLKEEWEKAQKEVEEEERKYYEEERKIIEDTVMPLTTSPVTSVHHGISETNGTSVSSHTELVPGGQEETTGEPWTEAKKNIAQTEDGKPQVQLWTLEGALHRTDKEQIQRNIIETEERMSVGESDQMQQQQCNTSSKLHLHLGVSSESYLSEDVRSLNNCVDNNSVQQRAPSLDSKGSSSWENTRDIGYSTQSSAPQCQSPNRSVSGKKLCSTCGLALGKGAAMIIETLSLYFHIQCFKCGICKGQLGDATTGTDVRIRNGLLNCNDCYARSRTAGHPTPL
ncbi:LIM and calponin homology domains-containing protein 1 isoform X3 [Pseudophryne corroboree]|uniref:LIM and calponin homology domains-containing protein 1 isoform X3 n=1 Tax=Pseudophryne corroboree TaxID=495146 RepID=UPI003081C8E0